MKIKTKIGLTLGLLSLLALGGLTQSKYVRNATIEMDVTNETDPGVFFGKVDFEGNDGSGAKEYVVTKTGYYALQLRGGDGGTNVNGIGGKGGVVEAIYYLIKDQKIYYNLGGRGGHYKDGSDNKTSGKGGHAAGGAGGDATESKREGAGGGGASGVYIDNPITGATLLVAGGGGGGSSSDRDPALGGVGASKVDGNYGASNYPGDNITGVLYAFDTGRQKDGDGKDGQSNLVGWGGGGSGGGFGTSYKGGRSGIILGRVAGAGTGGHSYVKPNINGVAFRPLTSTLKTTFAEKLPTAGTDFIPYNNGANTSGSTGTAGQFRIAYLWSDTEADHQTIENIYK
ncbi:hypothetical protein FACS1894192_04250 [Bacilli bacterium]|nr:hypothetical protein FACS1894192_04250 [Bacilli bacterium]